MFVIQLFPFSMTSSSLLWFLDRAQLVTHFHPEATFCFFYNSSEVVFVRSSLFVDLNLLKRKKKEISFACFQSLAIGSKLLSFYTSLCLGRQADANKLAYKYCHKRHEQRAFHPAIMIPISLPPVLFQDYPPSLCFWLIPRSSSKHHQQ